MVGFKQKVRLYESYDLINSRGDIMSKYVITATEIAEIMEVSKRTGYFIIKKLNCELTEKGYMTQAGRVSRKYFYERFGLEYSFESGK